jgi:hypothetical protein
VIGEPYGVSAAAIVGLTMIPNVSAAVSPIPSAVALVQVTS